MAVRDDDRDRRDAWLAPRARRANVAQIARKQTPAGRAAGTHGATQCSSGKPIVSGPGGEGSSLLPHAPGSARPRHPRPRPARRPQAWFFCGSTVKATSATTQAPITYSAGAKATPVV